MHLTYFVTHGKSKYTLDFLPNFIGEYMAESMFKSVGNKNQITSI